MRALAVISSRVGSHDQANIVSGEAMASILFEFLMCQLQNIISLCYHFGTSFMSSLVIGNIGPTA